VIQPRTVCLWAPMRQPTTAPFVVRFETAAELGQVEMIEVVGRDGVNADIYLFPVQEPVGGSTTWQRRNRVCGGTMGRGGVSAGHCAAPGPLQVRVLPLPPKRVIGQEDASLRPKCYVVERTRGWRESFPRLRYRVDRTAASFHAFVYLAILDAWVPTLD
jgi:hypothetical protein